MTIVTRAIAPRDVKFVVVVKMSMKNFRKISLQIEVCKVSIKYYVNIAMMISLFITCINSFSFKVTILCYNLQNK